MSGARGWLGSLTARITALTLLAVLLTAGVGTTAAVVLVQRANDQSAVRALSALADAADTMAGQSTNPELGLGRARRAMDSMGIQVAVVRVLAGRTVVTGDALARRVADGSVQERLVAGTDISEETTLDGARVLIEGRASGSGGIVLAQRRSDAVALGQTAVVRMVWAFAGVALLAVLVGWLVSRRVAEPLRRTAAAATELAAGRREVAVESTGPREVDEVAEAVNNLARSLAHSEARQREFLLSVSHDLRTPLTAVRGYAESLADGIIPVERVPEIGRIVGAEAERLERMVGDLLDLARLDAHEATLTLAPVDLGELLRSATPVWQHRCDAVGVELSVVGPDRPLVVRADPDRLRQAVDGLLDNALRVTPAGRPIVVAARAHADVARGGTDAAVLEVRDGGPGLAAEDYDVAFERSVLHERYRGRREVGTGLGLAIVARIVARHGGSVAAGPAPEGGACFSIRLPLEAGPILTSP